MNDTCEGLCNCHLTKGAWCSSPLCSSWAVNREHHDVTATRRMHGCTAKVHVVIDGDEVVLGGKRAERAASVIVTRWDRPGRPEAPAGVFGLRADMGAAQSEAERLTSTRPFRHRSRFTGATYESPRNPAAYAVAVPVLNALADEQPQPKEAHDMSTTTDTTPAEGTNDKEQEMAATTPADGTRSVTAEKALNPAPAKATTKKASPKKSTAKATNAPAPKLERNKVDRIAAATREAKAAKAAGWKWNKDDAKWERVEGRKAKPPTPNLDAINGGDGGASTKDDTKAKSAGRPASVQTVRLHHDGKPMPDSQNKLSSVAYYYTKDIKGKGHLSTDAFRALLAKETNLSEDDLLTHAWTVKLPNGITVSAKVERKSSTSKAA